MNIIVNREKIIAISNAVKQKAGMSEDDSLTLAEMPEKISSLEASDGIGLPDRPKDINFYDYDGTLLYAYSFDEAAALTELPGPVQHRNLLFQGWNEPDLDYIKRVKIPLSIGAVYTTADGKTHCHIRIGADGKMVKYTGCSIGGTMYINWGDETDTENYSCSSYSSPATLNSGLNLSHTYASAGDYDISIWAVDCEELIVVTDDLSDMYAYNNIESSLIEVNYSSQVKRIGTAANSGGFSKLKPAEMIQRVSIPESVKSIHYFLKNNDYGSYGLCYPLTVVMPTGIQEVSNIGYSTGICRIIMPRTVKACVSSGNCYIDLTDNDKLIAIFPDMKFTGTDSSSNILYPTITLHSGVSASRITDAYFIFAEAGEKLFSNISQLYSMRHIHVADELYDISFKVLKEAIKRVSPMPSFDCKRISMKSGMDYSADNITGENIPVVSDDIGAKIAISYTNSQLTGTEETIDSGILCAVAVTPSAYDGEIMEVEF